MTVEELLEILGIQKNQHLLINHPKMLQLLAYCTQEDVSVYEHSFEIKGEAFLVLLEEIHSLQVLVEILKKSSVLLNLNDTPYEIAKFYNLYYPHFLEYSVDSAILIDDEYLKYATKEWTENQFLQFQKILKIEDGKVFLQEHSSQQEEDIECYLYNLVALKQAKEAHLLKEALQKMME